LSKNFDRILLIQIRDSVTEKERQLRNPFSEDSSSLARTTEEFSSPIEALFSARIASSSFRNDGQLELLGQFQLLKKDQELQQQFGFPASPDQKPLTWKESPFLVVNFELDKTASLSWYLSNREKGEIKEAGENLRPKIQRIFEWWEKKDTMQAP
jgi:hypothetical protein